MIDRGRVEIVVDNYTNLRERYQCALVLTSGTVLESNWVTYNDTQQIEGKLKPQTQQLQKCFKLLVAYISLHIVLHAAAEVTLSSMTLVNRTATTLSVTWSAGYPKCYSFTVSHSTQDGSINVTQPADSDTSHTLTSLQPGTTYRIEVEAVRKGDRADRQRAKVMESFTTENNGEELE